jgi:hypothetical protein
MNNIADLWWLWLILAFVFFSYSVYNQYKRMQMMWKSHHDPSVWRNPPDITKGFGLLLASGMLGTFMFIFAILGVIVKIIQISK